MRAILFLLVLALAIGARAELVLMAPAAVDSAIDLLYAESMHGTPVARALSRLLLYHPPFDGALVAQAVLARYFVAHAAVAEATRASRRTTTCRIFGTAAADAVIRLRAHRHPAVAVPSITKARHAALAQRFTAECEARNMDPDAYADADARRLYRLFEMVTALAPATTFA